MAHLLRLRERGVEVLDREGEVVQSLSDLVDCVERTARLVIVQLEGIAALSFANEFNDNPLAASTVFRPRTFMPRRVV